MVVKVKKTSKESLYQRARQQAAAEALANGRITIPYACSKCGSRSIYRERADACDYRIAEDCLVCVTCGKQTPISVAKKERQKKIRDFIESGIDIA